MDQSSFRSRNSSRCRSRKIIKSGAISGSVWVHDRFQDRYGFMIGFSTRMGSWSVPRSVWVHDRFQERYDQYWFLDQISWTDTDSVTGPGMYWCQDLIVLSLLKGRKKYLVVIGVRGHQLLHTLYSEGDLWNVVAQYCNLAEFTSTGIARDTTVFRNPL